MNFTKPASRKFLTSILAVLGSLFLFGCEKVKEQQPERFEHDISISIPKAETGERTREVGEIIIDIRENGDVIINRNAITLVQLKQRLELIAKEFPDQSVILRGGANTRLQKIVDVLDQAKAAGLWNIAIATTKPE